MDGKAILEDDGEVVAARSTHYLSAASGERVLRFARKATPAAAMQAISPRARISYLVLCTNRTEVGWGGGIGGTHSSHVLKVDQQYHSASVFMCVR